jgi:tetratricopeptide (TPR) repeat protein
VLVHARHSRCPKCRAHLEVKPTAPTSSRPLKFVALGVVIAFAALVGGLWATRAEPVTDAAPPADPLKSRRGAAAAPAATASAASDGPVEMRPLREPDGLHDVGENALAAQAVASATLRDDPDNVAALGNLGAALLKLHEPAKALPLFEHAARIAPDQWLVQFNLARAQVELGRWKDAVGPLQAAKRLKPDDPVTLLDFAIVLHRAGDDERAIDEYRRAIATGVRDRVVQRSLAISLQRTHRTADAVQAYQEYLRLMPDAPDAEQIKERIGQLQASDRGSAPPGAATAPSR